MSNSEPVLSQDVIDRVQQSFKQVVPIADQVGSMFYARLIETHPETRAMFAAMPASNRRWRSRLPDLPQRSKDSLPRLDSGQHLLH